MRLAIAIVGGFAQRLLLFLEFLFLLTHVPALRFESFDVFGDTRERCFGRRNRRQAVMFNGRKLYVFIGAARLDLVGLQHEFDTALLGGGDLSVLGGKTTVVELLSARRSAQATQHLIERRGILMNIDGQRVDRGAPLPPSAQKRQYVPHAAQHALVGNVRHGRKMRRCKWPND